MVIWCKHAPLSEAILWPIFYAPATARKWLASDNLALNGRPVDLIRNTEGLVRVVHYLDASRAVV